MAREAEIFDLCAKAISRYKEARREDEHDTLIGQMWDGRRLLLELIEEFSSAEQNGNSTNNSLPVKHALRKVHPEKKYFTETVIRDLADVCETIRRICRTSAEIDQTKLFEARMSCTNLGKEFRESAT